MSQDKSQTTKIIATEYNYAEWCWMYKLADGKIVAGMSGEARISCGLNYNLVNQWGANQVFLSTSSGISKVR